MSECAEEVERMQSILESSVEENGKGNTAADKYDALKLENQLCFPLYAAAREIVKKYNPILEKIDLIYTHYIVMIV